MNRSFLGTASHLLSDPAEGSRPDARTIHWLLSQGVRIDAMASPLAVRSGRVVFDLGGRYRPNPIGAFALVIPVPADRSTIIIDLGAIDIVAWSPKSNKIGMRLGVVFGLGAEQIGVDGVGTTGLPIPVWRDPLGWLHAGRRGIVIADWDLAAFDLRGLILEAEDEPHRLDLVRRLTPRPPTVVVAGRPPAGPKAMVEHEPGWVRSRHQLHVGRLPAGLHIQNPANGVGPHVEGGAR